MFDEFNDQTQAKKAISCVKLTSNPKSNSFFEFLGVENLDSIFDIFS